jgi:hypothetical protein
MATIPKLALIPSGYKAGKIYSVLPTSGVGDFDFTRASSATRINSSGLIETVATGVPRLNYPLIDGVVNGCPSHLLEPSRTNIFSYSEQLDNAYWSKIGSLTINPNNAISPNGTTNAETVTTTAASSRIQKTINGLTNGTRTLSCFVKAGTSELFTINIYDGIVDKGAGYDILNGEVTYAGSGVSATITDYGNGWFRLTHTYNSAGTAYSCQFYFDEIGTYQVFGFQFEDSASYATSYIPTTTAAVTRSAEIANGAGDASTFNDSEGVLMAEISALVDDVTSKRIVLSNGTSSNNRVVIEYDEIFGLVKFWVTGSGTTNGEIQISGVKKTELNKISVLYKTNVLKIYINGFNVGNGTGIVVPTGLDNLKFEQAIGGNNFYGNTKQIQYYDSALNDSDLETLTSWTSFRDMANGQLYSIK